MTASASPADNANNQGVDHFCLIKLRTMLNIITDLEHRFRVTTTFLDGRDDLLAYPVAEVESTETLSVERDDAIRSTIDVGDGEIVLFSDFIDLSKYGATKYAGPVVYMFAKRMCLSKICVRLPKIPTTKMIICAPI